MTSELIKKYNVAAPRYTSYPTVPYWDNENWNEQKWFDSIRKSYAESSADGISLYIHLPFCESLCTYCGCNTRITKNHSVEEPYINAVVKEWGMYCNILGGQPAIKEIHLGGGTPTFFTAVNLKKLIRGIISRAKLTIDAEFSFEAHPANTTEEHLRTLYNCGFKRLSLGIQDFDPQVQAIINRQQSIQQVEHITNYARDLGFTSINFDLIYGLPLQKLSSVENTINEVIKLMPDRIAYYSYAHVPWIKPGQRKFTEADLPADDEKRALYEKGCELLSQAGYENIGMDHFALPSDSLYKASLNGQLHRNFMGYTHQYTKLSIGIGVSSISDSWYAFAQNIKKLELYLEKIGLGEFPILKGHILTDNDLEWRREILNIMCKGYTDMKKTDSILVKRLLPLRKDNLIKFNYRKLFVTSLGKSFLRNICMAFDERLWNSPANDQTFSKAV
ncbi:oxygen-independent coproporphyrinogen III oxidase [Pedobacter sp. P351]|uniref:oxygen-independent coproporphyrinogen III oxidase n=1 Tax=Pedobacter superstes TaxID=3133441 RepID=UPI00309AA120